MELAASIVSLGMHMANVFNSARGVMTMSLCCRRRQWLFMHGQMRILPDTEAGGTQLYVPLSLCPPGMVPVKTSRKSFKNKALGESTFSSRVLHCHGPHPHIPVIIKQTLAQFLFSYFHHPPSW
jgi:hypothetical protein